MARHPEPKAPSGARRDPKSRALIFTPSPENQRVDRLKNIVRKMIQTQTPGVWQRDLLEELDQV